MGVIRYGRTAQIGVYPGNQSGNLISYRSGKSGAVYCIPASFSNPLGVTQVVSNGKGVFEKPITFDDVDTVGDGDNTMYVDYVNGNDGSPSFGTNPAEPIKTLDRALNIASSFGPNLRILLLDPIIGRQSYSKNSTVINSINVKIVSGHASGRTIIAQNDENAVYSWVDNTDGSFSSSTASAENLVAAFDNSNQDADGLPSPLLVATSKANCQATPNSWYWDGVSELTVHMFDGRQPDSNWVISTVIAHNRYRIYSVSGFNSFHQGIVSIGPGSFNIGRYDGNQQAAKDCWVLGSNGDGFFVDGNQVVLEDCGAKYCNNDGFDYGTVGVAVDSCVYEINCKAMHMADTQYLSGASPSGSINCSTIHDGISCLSVNCEFSNSPGPVVSDVGGGDRWGFGCNAYNREGGPPVDGTSDIDGVYVMRGGGAMNLVECFGSTVSPDGATPFLFNGVVYRNWLGETPVTSYLGTGATEDDTLGNCP